MKEKIKFELMNVHVAPIIDEINGEIIYGDIIKIPGKVSLIKKW